jgi:type I restriction enzyme S subunit
VRIRDFDDGGRKQQMGDRSKYQRAIRGDIAYNMMRMWQGAVGVAPADGLVSPAYVVARPFPEVDAAYYAYLFRTAAYLREIDAFSRGIVPDRNRLYWEYFKQMPSVYPPLEEQRLIVRFLDWHGRQTGKLIRSKNSQLELVAEERQALTEDVVSAPGTRTVRLQHVVDVILRPVHIEDSEMYTPVGLYNRGRGVFHKPATRGSDLGDSDFFWIEDGALILSGQFAWEGAVALASHSDAGCVASHRYHLLRGREGSLNTGYIAALLKSSFGQLLLDEHSRGAAGRNRPLNIRTLLKEAIPVPPLTEQKHLVRLVSLEREFATTIADLSNRLREFRSRLIADVVTGKLDVRAAAAGLPEELEVMTEDSEMLRDVEDLAGESPDDHATEEAA